MAFLDESTRWIFLYGSDEERHAIDVIFAYFCLRHVGVPADRISAYIDSTIPLPPEFPTDVTVKPSTELIADLAGIQEERLVLIVTGHGPQEGGVHTSPIIKPFPLIDAIRSAPHVKQAVLVLGQCFAGSFRYLNIDGNPEMCILAATDLSSSLSLFTTIQDAPFTSFACPQAWVANTFLYKFMRWVVLPEDIDGDGALTVKDAFQHASIESNLELEAFRSRMVQDIFMNVITGNLHMLLPPAHRPTQMPQLQTPQDKQAFVKQLRTGIDHILSTVFVEQNSWILNANVARSMRFVR